MTKSDNQDLKNTLTNEVGILGCGWLGTPLAKCLVKKGFSVKGTTTSEDKVRGLNKIGVNTFIVNLTENKIDGDIDSFLQNVKILIIDIPPKLRKMNPENFVAKIKNLIPHLDNSDVSKLIFVSSTSVFADDAGEVDEDSAPNPDTDSGIQLLQVENIFRKNKNFETTILRFGGLIGADRHPSRTLSGKINVSKPEAPINLIHRSDCLKIIETIIANDIFGKIIHGVAPYHPSRSEYYIAKCDRFNIPPPEFKFAPTFTNKVLNSKVLGDMGYAFLVAEL